MLIKLTNAGNNLRFFMHRPESGDIVTLFEPEKSIMNKPAVAPKRTTLPIQPHVPGKIHVSQQDGTDKPMIDESSKPYELIEWGLKNFSDQPNVLTTSFGMEGCAMMDMCSKAIEKHGLKKLTIASIDTGFFFPETLQLRSRLIERYPNLEFTTWETPVSIQEQAETFGDQLWKNNPNMCCHIRKVQPMQDHIHKYHVWMTALRRTQTEERASLPVLGWDWKYQLLKFCPLATWTRSDVWDYIQKHDVPFNQLHLQNYPSISCYHCTKSVPNSNPEDEIREGRWSGKDKTECGLHYSI